MVKLLTHEADIKFKIIIINLYFSQDIYENNVALYAYLEELKFSPRAISILKGILYFYYNLLDNLSHNTIIF